MTAAPEKDRAKFVTQEQIARDFLATEMEEDAKQVLGDILRDDGAYSATTSRELMDRS